MRGAAFLFTCLAFCVVGCYAAATVNHEAEFWKAGAGGLRLTDTEADTYVKHVEGIVAPLAKPPAKYHHPENSGKIKEFADYSHRKDEWNPSKFTVPGKAAPHYNMQKFRMIVTSIRDDDPTFKSPAYWSLFNPDFQKDLLLSCSVIDQHHTNTWFLSGFVLKVPAQNVIAASHRDLMLGNGVYLNNAPSVLVDEVKSKLKRATDAAHWKAHSVHPREFYVQGTADKPKYSLLSPEEVLAQSATDYKREYAATDTTHEIPTKGAVQHDDHNEIGVLGTSLDGKHQIEIVAVWYKVRAPSEGVKSGQWLVTPQRMALLEHVAKTHNLPLIPIFDHGKDPKPKKEKKDKKDKKPETEKKQKKEKKEKAPAADKKPEDHHDASHPEHLAPNTH